MGRPYSAELEQLAATYAWAATVDLGGLRSAVGESVARPLLSVGSGGSLTAAHLHALLHRTYAGSPARATTPLEAVENSRILGSHSVWFVTAGGRNPDIIGAIRSVALAEPRDATLLCLRPRSPASVAAHEFEYVRTVEFEPVVTKDGFLATNSLLALAVLLTRAYVEDVGASSALPPRLDDLIPSLPPAKSLRRFLGRGTFVALCSPTTHPAAIDLESKFTEAALGHVQVSDFRNFAHGRHHWLAKRADESAVVAFSTSSDRRLAERTLALLPPDVPQLHVKVGSGAPGAVAALVSVLQLVGLVGAARGIDPGRPHVPTFGRRIYHLRGIYRGEHVPPSVQAAAIRRKQRAAGDLQSDTTAKASWVRAYTTFVGRLKTARFGAVILDYDGTLCRPEDRFSGIRAEVGGHIERLLRAGALVGIATGRGKSVRKDLRSKIPPEFWPSVTVGYYNGGDVAALDDDAHPLLDAACRAPASIGEALENHPALLSSVKVTTRASQVTVEPTRAGTADALFDLISGLASSRAASGIAVVCSGHSIDILAPGVSKQAVVERVTQALAAGGRQALNVLCIGDRGRWPGNDFALLNQEFALSADEVSASPDTCWNIAPAGHRGVQATLGYLSALSGKDGRFRLELPALDSTEGAS